MRRRMMANSTSWSADSMVAWQASRKASGQVLLGGGARAQGRRALTDLDDTLAASARSPARLRDGHRDLVGVVEERPADLQRAALGAMDDLGHVVSVGSPVGDDEGPMASGAGRAPPGNATKRGRPGSRREAPLLSCQGRWRVAKR